MGPQPMVSFPRHLQVVLECPAYGIQALKILDADLGWGTEMAQIAAAQHGCNLL